MDKQLLERFIGKYNLGGAAESVTVTSQNNGIRTRFISDDKNILGAVECSSIELEEGEYGIYNTAQFRSLLSVLESVIKIKVIKTKEVPTGFLVSDEGTKVTYVLADKQNIPPVPDLKSLPEFEVTISLDQKFMNTFIKAKSALPDVDTFTLLSDEKKTTVVLGHSEINTNRIAVAVDAEVKSKIDPISFSAKYLKEILLSNKEMTKGSMRISSKGLAHIDFSGDSFDANYYLVKIERRD
jgi:hypothetical protein